MPHGGRFHCQQCWRPFEYRPVTARTALTAACAPVQSTEEIACALHAGNLAMGSCERCGDFMCPLCAIEIEGRTYCTRCFDLLYQRGSFQIAQRAFTLPGNALKLAMLSLPGMMLYGLGCVTAVASILMAVSALRQIGLRPDLPGKSQALAAIGIATVALLLVGACVLLIANIGKLES